MNSIVFYNAPANMVVSPVQILNPVSVPIYQPNGSSSSHFLSEGLFLQESKASWVPVAYQMNTWFQEKVSLPPPINENWEMLNSQYSQSTGWEDFQTPSSKEISMSDYCLCGLDSVDNSKSLFQGCSKEIKTSKIKKTRWIPKTEDDSVILKGYKFKFRYESTNGRRKKIIVWKYDGCEKEFTKTWSFLYHARMHEGEKPFKCNAWERTFSQKSNLTKHMKHHVLKTVNERKLFRCSICPKGYTERYNLRVSINSYFKNDLLTFYILLIL